MVTTQFVIELTAVIRVALLSAAFVFAAIAARGYRDAPWGGVLRPLPLAIVGFSVSVVTLLVNVPGQTRDVVTLVGWSVGVAAIAVSTYRFVNLVAYRGDRR